MKTLVRFVTLLLTLHSLSIMPVRSQWQQSDGLFEGSCMSIIAVDSILYASIGGSGIYAKFPGENWELSLNHPGQLIELDSCIILTAPMRYPYRTFNQGETWEELPDFIESGASIGNVLFKADFFNVYRSTDYGSNYEIVSQELIGFRFDKVLSDDSLLIIHETGTHKIFKSTDLGNNWDSIPFDGLNCYRIDDLASSNQQIWINTDDGLFSFDEQDQQWQPASNGLPTGTGIYKFVEKEAELYGSGNKGVYKWDKVGELWLPFSSEEKNGQAICVMDGDFYCGAEYMLFRLDTTGNWHDISEGVNGMILTSLIGHNDVLYACGRYVYRSFNSGTDFEKMNGLSGLPLNLLTTDSLFYLVTGKDILSSNDQGETWDTITGNLEATIEGIAISDNYYHAISTEGYFRTPPGTINWEKPASSIQDINAYQIIASDSIVLISSVTDGLWISSDYGISFSEIFWGDIDYILKSDSLFYCLRYNRLYFSNNPSESWDSLFLPGNDILHICFDIAGDTILLGSHFPFSSEYEVNLSTDFGKSWNRITDDLPAPVVINAIYKVKIYNDRLFVNPSSRGLFHRDDLLTSAKPSQSVHSIETVRAYPNPFYDSFSLECKNCQIMKWELFDLKGRCVRAGSEKKINAGLLPKGIYLIKIYFGSNTYTRKLIKI